MAAAAPLFVPGFSAPPPEVSLVPPGLSAPATGDRAALDGIVLEWSGVAASGVMCPSLLTVRCDAVYVGGWRTGDCVVGRPGGASSRVRVPCRSLYLCLAEPMVNQRSGRSGRCR